MELLIARNPDPESRLPYLLRVPLPDPLVLRACNRRGAAVDLVLDRTRESRSQTVFTTACGQGAPTVRTLVPKCGQGAPTIRT